MVQRATGKASRLSCSHGRVVDTAGRADGRWGVAWSPEQIARRLRLDFPDDASMRISHEAIYQALHVRGRGGLHRELSACLRTGGALRVPQTRTRGRGKRLITPEVMISPRPAEVTDRLEAGHWEGDLIIGLDKSAIGTLVERSTRFRVLLHFRLAWALCGWAIKRGNRRPRPR